MLISYLIKGNERMFSRYLLFFGEILKQHIPQFPIWYVIHLVNWLCSTYQLLFILMERE